MVSRYTPQVRVGNKIPCIHRNITDRKPLDLITTPGLDHTAIYETNLDSLLTEDVMDQ